MKGVSFPFLIAIQESVHVLTGGTKFYLEPVDSTAVDERRKHSHSASERITDGTHSQYHVQICANTLNEEVVHRQRSSVDFTALRKKKLNKLQTFVNLTLPTCNSGLLHGKKKK